MQQRECQDVSQSDEVKKENDAKKTWNIGK